MTIPETYKPGDLAMVEADGGDPYLALFDGKFWYGNGAWTSYATVLCRLKAVPADAIVLDRDKVEAVLSNHPTCDLHPDQDEFNPVRCGWKAAYGDLTSLIREQITPPPIGGWLTRLGERVWGELKDERVTVDIGLASTSHPISVWRMNGWTWEADDA